MSNDTTTDLSASSATSDISSRSMTDVFIIHSHQDRPFVDRLAKQLEEEGLAVRLDVESISPGSDIAAGIMRGISSARAVLVVLGDDRTPTGDWVQFGAAIALAQKDKLVIPVVTTNNAYVPFMLRHLKAVDLSDEAKFREKTRRLALFLKHEPAIPGQDPGARIERLAVESEALNRMLIDFSKLTRTKNIGLVAGAAALAVTITTVVVAGAASVAFFREMQAVLGRMSSFIDPYSFPYSFYDPLYSLVVGTAVGLVAQHLYKVVKQLIAARLTKRTGDET